MVMPMVVTWARGGDGGYVGHMDGFGGYEGTRSKLQQSAIFTRSSVHCLALSGKSLERKS